MIYVDVSEEFPDISGIKLNEKISDILKVSYKQNINICQIHQYIKRNFAIRKTKVEFFKKLSEVHMERSRSHELTFNQKNKLIRKSKECLDMSQRCDSEEDWINYITGAKNLLLDYVEICEQISKIRISKSPEELNFTQLIDERIIIIEKYFSVLSQFIRTDISRNHKDFYKCPVCTKIFDEKLIVVEYNHYSCECGHSFYLISRDIAYHNQLSPTNSPEDIIDSFTETIDRYCGKQSGVIIPDELFRQFDTYRINNGNLTGAQIKKLPVEVNKHKEKIGNLRGTSVSLLISMLKNTNNTLYYDNINLIGHKYFGWILPDLSDWIGDIMKIYDLTKKVYNRMVNKRLSVLNGNVILFYILNYLNIPCSKDDFKLMDTKNSSDNYKENWEIMSKDKDVIKARDEIFEKRKMGAGAN